MERVQSPSVSSKLLHGSCSEGVASSDQHLELVLDQPETNLGQISALPNPIHTTEGDHVRLLVFPGVQYISKNVDSSFWCQKFHQRSRQCVLHCPVQGLEGSHDAPFLSKIISSFIEE